MCLVFFYFLRILDRLLKPLLYFRGSGFVEPLRYVFPLLISQCRDRFRQHTLPPFIIMTTIPYIGTPAGGLAGGHPTTVRGTVEEMPVPSWETSEPSRLLLDERPVELISELVDTYTLR